MSKKWGWLFKTCVAVGAVAVVSVSALTYFQHKLIYLPRRYQGLDYYSDRMKEFEVISYSLSGHASSETYSAFYMPPPHSERKSEFKKEGSEIPSRIFIFFGGNAQLALDWTDFLRYLQVSSGHSTFSAASAKEGTEGKKGTRESIGFFLVDYPSYGEGPLGISPSPATILQATNSALEGLARWYQFTPQELAQKTKFGVLGHSLGCAASLQWVKYALTEAKYPITVDRVILMSPFTSLTEVAKYHIPPVPSFLIRHNFDNSKNLTSILNHINSHSQPSPKSVPKLKIKIIHGTYDTIVPVWMGQRLFDLSKSLQSSQFSVTYHELECDHNDLLFPAVPLVRDYIFS